MTRHKVRARTAVIPMNNSLPPYLFNLSFLAIAMAIAALAVFGN